MMLKIGDFARLAHVSLKTLHHYDEIGLFRPQHIDRFTGYRYYALEQLPRLNRILVLKGLGFSLEQVRQMMQVDLSADELRGMLRLRQAQVEQEIEQATATLRQLQIRLRQIEQEQNMPIIDILTKVISPLTIVGAREVVPGPAQMRERCMALNEQACQFISDHQLRTDGVSLALYYDNTNGIDVEMAYAVEGAAPGQSLLLHQLPTAIVCYATYSGSYDDFGAVGQLHGALHQWIEQNGYRITGPVREWYLRPASDSSGLMEIQYPVEKS